MVFGMFVEWYLGLVYWMVLWFVGGDVYWVEDVV